jgi:hypothetical protein
MPSQKINGVLVKISIRIFPNTREDKSITDEVRARKSLGIGAGKWLKHVLPDECLKPIREIGREARQTHYDMTLPWEDNYRLLSAKAHDSYEDRLRAHTAVFDKAVEAFGDSYDSWVKQAKIMHGKTFNPEEYPVWETMAANFGIGREITPVPVASHFVSSITGEAVAALRSELESRNETRVREAVKDTWNRLIVPVQHIADKLTGRDAIFRDSLIENVREIVDLVPALNITGDAQLVALAQTIKEQFASLDPELLRENHAVRRDTAAAARSIMERFGGIGRRKFAA